METNEELQNDLNRALAELDYERRLRIAAEEAANNTQDVRRCERPGRLATFDWESEQWH